MNTTCSMTVEVATTACGVRIDLCDKHAGLNPKTLVISGRKTGCPILEEVHRSKEGNIT